jgi:hypothetical protein
LASKSYGDASFGVSATATSGQAVSYGNRPVSAAPAAHGVDDHDRWGEICTVGPQAGDRQRGIRRSTARPFSVGQKSVTVP